MFERLVENAAEADASPQRAGGPAEIHQLAQRRLDTLQLSAYQLQLFRGVVVAVAPLQHLNQRADRRERIADLMSDPRGQEPEGRHLFLVQQVGLRLVQLAGSLGNAFLEQSLVFLERVVDAPEVLAHPLEEHGQGR